MVTARQRRLVGAAFALLLGLGAHPALALLGQTQNDLAMLEDALKQGLEEDPQLKDRLTPMLLATPVHFWVESRDDFASATTKMLSDVFPGPKDLTPCPDCDGWRLHVAEGERVEIDNGELGLRELGGLTKDPRFAGAKALTMVRETPSGIELRITSLADGHILYEKLADSSVPLDSVKPWMNYQQERERRLRGESLSYAFINLGLLPKPLFQVEFLEQWGDHNQHISGIGLSLLNPNVAIGAVYHYLIPGMRRLHVAGSLYFPLQNLVSSSVPGASSGASVVGQGMVQYAFANSYAVFASVSSQGVFSIGFNFYNPLFLPFLL